jgi:hypothetical protein
LVFLILLQCFVYLHIIILIGEFLAMWYTIQFIGISFSPESLAKGTP